MCTFFSLGQRLTSEILHRFFATQPVGSADFVLENSAQNSLERYRYDAPRLVLRLKNAR
ncbi:MAG: hypothetical protein SPG65_00840 [Campylobacter sp.]|uniref:hypothetical protein n=1 Tax=Campylobacter sp. TaxID=205 RepID=UPI002A58AAB8|nr:hypothetical protein [Campylobacter sp.]MDD7090695.1 hypothetical protein [Campylobacteraceae bacterium]MDY5285308.1 hypothetical protein [Campylobacter sp.]MDY5383651.1 hypothetical protein [Campylobacter sp.]